MAKKTIFIAFAHGGILPAAVIGKKKDFSVPANTPVLVPADYGQHLIDDRFAYDATEMAEAIMEAEQAADQKKAIDLAAAGKVVEDAKAKLAAATDDAAKADAQAELTKAEEALAALKA